MLFRALEFTRINLNNYINEILDNDQGSQETYVLLGNIANTQDLSTTPNTDEREMVYISLVNVEEEYSLKNERAYHKNLNGSIDYQNPPVYANLYVLFSANHTDYNVALQRLSQVMAFFQGKNKFTFSSAPVAESGVGFTFTEEERNNFKLSFDLYTLTFEQINHLWGSLGGKAVPFVLYKVRLVEIEHEVKQRGGQIITEIIQKTY